MVRVLCTTETVTCASQQPLRCLVWPASQSVVPGPAPAASGVTWELVRNVNSRPTPDLWKQISQHAQVIHMQIQVWDAQSTVVQFLWAAQCSECSEQDAALHQCSDLHCSKSTRALSKPQTPHEIWARICASMLWLRRPKSNSRWLVVVDSNSELPNLRLLPFLLPQLVPKEWLALSCLGCENFFSPLASLV